MKKDLLVFLNPRQISINPVFPADHSMGSRNFLRYIRSKITSEQFALLSIAVCNDFRIECHSFFFEDLEDFLVVRKLKMLNVLQPMPFSYKKIANNKRPSWLLVENEEGETLLTISVSPTKEYLLQYASIVQSAVLFLCPRGQRSASYTKAAHAAEAMKAFYYPEIAEHYSDRLGLTAYLEHTKGPDDVYVIGEGDKAFAQVISDGLFVENVHDSTSFSVIDLALPDAIFRIRIIAIKHSFWGSAAGNVAKVCAELGSTKGIVYIAKLGAISQKLDLFDMVSPCKFLLWEANKVTHIQAPPAFFDEAVLSEMGVVQTVHVSLPTLVEETNFLLNHFNVNGAEAIDNEISFIAASIALVNRRVSTPVPFSCLHIVTDKPSSSIFEKLNDGVETSDINHLLSKDNLQYRRQKNHHHRHFLEIFNRTIIYERPDIGRAIA